MNASITATGSGAISAVLAMRLPSSFARDSRFRVNECYCAEATWQHALTALVERSDVVLMDLRGFQARDAGCRHELEVLAALFVPSSVSA